jgi:hypothetical protein
MIAAGEVWLAGAEASVPILDIGIVRGLQDDAIKAVTDAVYSMLVELVDVAYIQFVDAAKQSAWAQANEALAIVGREQGVNSAAYQAELTQQAALFAQFVHTGS